MKQIIFPDQKEDTICVDELPNPKYKQLFVGFVASGPDPIRCLLFSRDRHNSTNNLSCLTSEGDCFRYNENIVISSVAEHRKFFKLVTLKYFYFESFQEATDWLHGKV